MLISPGVQVSIVDESFFVPAAATTIPVFFVATGEDKLQTDGNPAIATSESGTVRVITSLQQSLELYGIPKFYEDDSGRPFHGDSRNEYGLLALNQYLGIGNLAYVVRANVNTNDDITDLRTSWLSNMSDSSFTYEELITSFIDEYNIANGFIPSDAGFKTTVTASEAKSLANTATIPVWEKFSFSGLKTDFFDDNTLPAAASAGTQTANFGGTVVGGNVVGLAAAIYTASIVVDSVTYPISWTVTGGETFTDLVNELDADMGVNGTAAIVAGNILVTSATTGATSLVSISDTDLFSSIISFVSFLAPIDGIDATPGTQTVDYGGTMVESDASGLLNTATYTATIAVDGAAPQAISVAPVLGTETYTNIIFDIQSQLTGATINVVGGDIIVTSSSSGVASAISIVDGGTALFAGLGLGSAVFASILAAVPGTIATSGLQTANFSGSITGANLLGLSIGASTAPKTASVNVDGTNYAVGYPTGTTGTETYTTFIATLQADIGIGNATVVDVAGDIVITSVATGSISTVLISDNNLFSSLTGFVAFNAAVPGLDGDVLMPVFENGYDQPQTDVYYGFDGKVSNCVSLLYCPTTTLEFTATEARDMMEDASDLFQYTVEFKNLTSLGANDAARRAAIVTGLQAAVNSNFEVRSEVIEYNLIACPGFNEVADELKTLSVDIGEEAMVIADTPMDMDPEQVVVWGDTNSQRQRGTTISYFYPSSLMSNIDGKTVVGSATGTAIRTIAYSDSISEVWFAPAGTRRGLVSGVVAVGYVSGTLGTPTTFEEAALSQGQRDNLYKYFTNLNPITFMPGRGILVFGQKTSSPDASARDRINVERMLMFVKRQLRKSALSFVFEPNDSITRGNLKNSVDGFLNDIMTKRGLFDFATVCDESNNTPQIIDNNQMLIDIALKPSKAAEFIIIPIRVVATGADI